MRINYTLDETGRIISAWDFPYDPDKPSIEIESWEDIVIGDTGIKDGKLVSLGKTPESLAQEQRARNQQEIEYLKQLLAEEDYKIIKCYEAQLTNKPMPYDLQELITKRDQYRTRINELESEMINSE